jgi:hypothetical protein
MENSTSGLRIGRRCYRVTFLCQAILIFLIVLRHSHCLMISFSCPVTAFALTLKLKLFAKQFRFWSKSTILVGG